jgi:hypothetical protein
MVYALKDLDVTCKQVRRIMKRAGFKAIFRRKNLLKASTYHPKYLYLLLLRNTQHATRNKKI